MGRIAGSINQIAKRCNYDHVVDRLMEVYTSWIDAVLYNYNTDFYYQSREYIYECYKEGQICA